MRPLRALLPALLLAACSSGDYENPFPFSPQALTARLGGGGGQPVVTAEAAGVEALDGAVVAKLDIPLILAVVEKTKAAATITRGPVNNGYETWFAADRSTVTMKGGVVSATRGLPEDLLAADVDATLAALRAGGGSYPRSWRHTGGERQIAATRYDCTLSRVGPETITLGIVNRAQATVRYTELCRGPAGEVRNDFWTAGGMVWQSRQWLSPAMGHIATQRLLP